jgi:hypothetical protein
LEGLGWRFHRIWSTDWFHRRGAEIDRLRAALEAAAFAEGPAFSGANTGGRRTPAAEPAAEPSDDAVLPPPPELSAPAYVPSSFTVNMSVEPHEAPIYLLVDLVSRIVTAEGPIHCDLVARRVSAAFGKTRTGGRIQSASDQALTRAVRSAAVLMEGDFAMTEAQRCDCPVRDRSGDNAPAKAELLPPVEIQAAATRVILESGEMQREDLIVATARLLGFAKTGKELRDRIDRAIPRTDA